MYRKSFVIAVVANEQNHSIGIFLIATQTSCLLGPVKRGVLHALNPLIANVQFSLNPELQIFPRNDLRRTSHLPNSIAKLLMVTHCHTWTRQDSLAELCCIKAMYGGPMMMKSLVKRTKHQAFTNMQSLPEANRL